ncbi:MAG: hypothetical protein KGR48_01185 [Alphaproteobacteria bacterium]|nr:hypothetical protein [Alphaproteobacteria bacterium]MBU6471111.1 hypothetical protein [Alphaproteobacteria bacterium]MDE2012188.1 hypothetical protein [Alphaproteobacteria bacterium]MDE2072201.1 hypothetical protein [Alphaproteobacteria bacterium]MDE2351750.1 hypothetical protein [Alphaproteobacteria bacterium]
MLLRPVIYYMGVLAALAAVMPAAPAAAGGFGPAPGSYGAGSGWSHGPACNTGGSTLNIYKPVTISNNVNIYKPVTINKNVNIYKPVTIDKSISIYKPVTITKDISITKNIDLSKNINISKNISINKSIVINKGGSSSAEASAIASAFAQAMASASASVTVNNNISAAAGAGASAGAAVYNSNSYQDVKIVNRGGAIGAVHAEQHCTMQEASVVKAIHAVCVAANGEEFPASHMIPDTWIDTSYEGEVARCIPGAHLKVTIGDVLQSDQGMAGTYANGTVIACGMHEALRHYKDGMLKCAPAVPVPDCTERTNLRRYGTGDLFFSFRAQVCVESAAAAQSDLDVSGMTLDGGVGEDSTY